MKRDHVYRQARAELVTSVTSAMKWRHRFIIRHWRVVPSFLRVRALRAYRNAQREAEAAMPRRYRRALRGTRMVPARSERRG